MTKFLMSMSAATDVASFDALNRNELIAQQTLTRDGVKRVGGVSAGRRVLQVLIVDDEQDTTDELVRLVRRAGHDAHRVHHGFTALRVATLQQPELVLLDLETPLMDGCQVARQLRLDFPRRECFIIAFTARADDERRHECIEAGIDLLLSKPLDPSVIETLLLLERMHANRRRAQQADNNRRSFDESGGMSC